MVGADRSEGDYWVEPVAYGEAPVYAAPPEADFCPIRFQGQWEDAETGLFYNRFRYYEPLVGQYVSADPIGIFGDARNVSYTKNPSASTDSFGLSPLMHSVVNRSGGRTWVSNAPVCQRDFSDIVDSLSELGQVVVVSGTHGQESGLFDPDLRERSFYLEDMARWRGNTNVTVLDAFELTDAQLTSALNQENSIAAWCYSDKDERVIKSLGCCRR